MNDKQHEDFLVTHLFATWHGESYDEAEANYLRYKVGLYGSNISGRELRLEVCEDAVYDILHRNEIDV